MNLRRYIQAGATFAWPLNGGAPLQEARDRHVPTGAPGVVNSPYGRALIFDGANDYVTLGAAWEDQLRFDAGTDDFSVVAWVRRAVTGAYHTIMDKRDASGDGWVLYLHSNDSVSFELNTFVASGGTPVVDDTFWHCIAATVDRSTIIRTYLDGQDVGGTRAIAGPVMATTAIPQIAIDASSKFEGDIAGVLVFPRILAPAECLGIASGGGPF